MKCIGKKTDGSNCKANAQSGFFTCTKHRPQEPDAGGPSEAVGVQALLPEVHFQSGGKNHSHIIRPRKVQVIDGERVQTQSSIRADFISYHFKTRDATIIDALREYIRESPNNRRVWEI